MFHLTDGFTIDLPFELTGMGLSLAAAALMTLASPAIAQTAPASDAPIDTSVPVVVIVKVPKPWYAPEAIVVGKMRDTMKITDPGPEVVTVATQGTLVAIDTVLMFIQPGVFNLAVRMLGNRDDAADATQEILLKVVTRLGSFRSEAAFTTWVFQIARNHLLTASTKAKESPEVSLEAMADRSQAGLEFGAAQEGFHA